MEYWEVTLDLDTEVVGDFIKSNSVRVEGFSGAMTV